MFDSAYMEIAWALSLIVFSYIVTASYYEDKMSRVFGVMSNLFRVLNRDDVFIACASHSANAELLAALDDVEIVISGGKVHRIANTATCEFSADDRGFKFCMTHRCSAPAGAPSCRVAKP